MSYDLSTGGSQVITATELVVSLFSHVDSGFYDAKYPELMWRKAIPKESVKADINPGAKSYVYRTRDYKGMGQFVLGDTRNIPRVGQTIGQVSVPVLSAAVGSILTNDEVRTYAFAHHSALAQEYGAVMKRASEYHVERTFFYGNAAVNFDSFLDYPHVAKTTVIAWSANDPGQMVADINAWITLMWTRSKLVHLADTVFLPPAMFSLLMTAYVIGAGTAGVAMSALEYIKKNNIYTANTQNELKIIPLRYLEGAGPLGVNRAIIMEWKSENFVLPFPLTYQLSQPVPADLAVKMFAEYIFGSFNVRYPMAMLYADGL